MSKLTKADAYDYKLEQIADEYELEPNPAPGPKWKALSGIPRISNLCGNTQALLECIVELAHDHWGFAFPSRKYIQLWTGRSRWAIDRAIAKAKQFGLIETVERRVDYEHSMSTLMIVNWEPFFAAYERVQLLRRKDDGYAQNCARVCAELRKGMRESAKQSTSYLSTSNMSGSSARSALCELSSQNENPSLESETTTSPHVESPKGFHEERTISHPANQLAARQRVQRHISGAVFILNNPPSSAAVQEAVMAELNEEGSGRPILNRAANETWRKRRRSE